MNATWPPSPSVEDEAAALAHEYSLDSSIAELKSDHQQAVNKGTVNQYPIILDPSHEPVSKEEETKGHLHPDNSAAGSQSSDESNGPATPPPVNRDQRFVYVPTQESKAPPIKVERAKPRSKSRHRPKEDDTPRGRPNVSRIQTDLGSDLKEMMTGSRRAPSPYAYKPGQMVAERIVRRGSREQLLSPQPVNAYRGSGATDLKRAASAKPHSKDEIDSPTDFDRRSERRSHSHRRSSRKSISRSDRPTLDRASTTAFETLSPQYAHIPADPGLLSKELKESSDSICVPASPSQSRKTSKESSYHSSAEEARSRKHSEYASRSEKRISRDSPLTSGDETRARHHHHRDDNGRRSRRSSTHRGERPRLDSASQQHSYIGWESPVERHDNSKHRHDLKHHSVFDGRTYLEPATPSSSKTPQAMEDAWEKAFRDNQAKASAHTGRASVNPSPRTSPPQTPPRIPRGDRRSKDFHELNSPTSQPPQQWARSPSFEQSFFKEPKPLAAVVAAAAGSAASILIPSLSRSSTSSQEMASSGSTSKPSSGHRSRKPSPVYEEARTVSRSGSYASREERPALKSALKPSAFPNIEETSVARGGLYVHSPLDHPGLPQRAFSYNSAVQPAIQRPASSHRYSSGLLPVASLPESVPKPTQPGMVHASSSSAEKSLAATSEPTAIVVPPPCPRSVQRAGYADWYTIKGIPEIDVCPSCMGTLGGSRFRDHFIPSMPKPRNQEVKCSMSSPWIRVAWVQIQKQNRPTLELLWKLTHPPPSCRPCPGKKFAIRPWFRLTDPHTGRLVPNFDVCSACVHAIDQVFPHLEGALERSDGLHQELGCNLNTESRRFFAYIGEFEKAHARCRGGPFRKDDVQGLADYARRASRVRECARDGPLLTSAWHFHPDLPDFTICEECYEEVVWPIADKPIARNVNRTLKLVPTTRPGQFVNGRTCQLYSERMRKLFLEAVKHNDFEILRVPALKRLNAEQLLQEQHALHLRDMKAGVDRKAEIERNSHIWKTWE